MLRMYMWFDSLRESLRDREEGQALVEYALILALISVVAITALEAIGTGVTAKLNEVAGSL